MAGLADDSGFSSALDRGADAAIRVRFHIKPKHDPEASKLAGRPIYRDVEYAHFMVPDDPYSQPDKEVTDLIRERFRLQYEHWKSTANVEKQSGTPLAEWPGATRGQVEELRYYKCATVEQLAEKTDIQLRDIPELLALRQKARDYLAKAQDAAPLEQMRAALQEKDTELTVLRRQLKERDDALTKDKKARAVQ